MVGENKVASTRYHNLRLLRLLLRLLLPVHADAKHGNQRNNLGMFFGTFCGMTACGAYIAFRPPRCPRNVYMPGPNLQSASSAVAGMRVEDAAKRRAGIKLLHTVLFGFVSAP